jgi:hypothetical protein
MRWRVPEILFGALLAVAVFAMGAVFSYSIQPPHQQAQQKQAATEPNQSAVPVPAKKEPDANDRIADYTLALVILTVVMAVATVGLWYIANATARRQLRAYVAVYGTKFEAKPGRFESHLEIKNTGQTPARNCRIINTARIMLHPPPPGYDFSILDSAGDPSESVLGAGQKIGSVAYFEKTEFTKEEFNEAMREDGWLRIYTYGTVRYSDVFGKRQRTNFCFFFQVRDLDGKDGKGVQLSATNSQYHNEAS